MRTRILVGSSLVLLVTIAGLILWGNRSFEIQTETNGPTTDTPPVKEYFKEVSTELRLGVTSANFGGIEVTPLQVTSDSRCAVDVTCIWAGTVTLKTLVKTGTAEQEISLSLGEEKRVGIYSLTLTAVEPGTHSQKRLNPEDYRFTFKITKDNN